MKIRALAAALLALAALTVSAEVKNGINHTPLACIRAGELGLLQVKTASKGELRGYFRRINTTDWCSVEGTNDGVMSNVVLPKFENGDEIEYFFVIVDGTRIMARSPRIYRVRVASECETPFARHMIRMTLNCGEDTQAFTAAVMGGYLVGDDIVGVTPRTVSPDQP